MYFHDIDVPGVRDAFNFGLRKVKSGKCISVLLLLGCCSQNTFDSKIVTKDYSQKASAMQNLFAILYLVGVQQYTHVSTHV